LSVAQWICFGIGFFLLLAIPLTLWGRFIFFPYVGAGVVGFRVGWNTRFVNGKPFPQNPSRAALFTGLRFPLSLPWMASRSSAESGPTSPRGMALAELVAALPFVLSAASPWVLHKADPILFVLLVGLPLSIYVLHGAAQGIIVVYRSHRASSAQASHTNASTPISGRAVISRDDASACQTPEHTADPGTPPDVGERHTAPVINPTARTEQIGDAPVADEIKGHEQEEGYVLGDDPVEQLGDRTLGNAPTLVIAVYHVALGLALLSVLVFALINLHAAYEIGYSLRIYSAAAVYIVGVIEATKRFFAGTLRLWRVILYIDAVILLSAVGIVPSPIEVWHTLTGS
jgi:hypothetical protein